MSTARTSRRMGIAQACAICYQKKIRCDLASGKTCCTNCSLYNTECRPRFRKRKRASGYQDQDPENGHSRRQSQSQASEPMQLSPVVSPSQPEAYTDHPRNESLLDTAANAENISTAVPEVTQPGPGVTHQASHRTPSEETSETTPTGRIHDGRAVYFESIQGRNVESTKAYPQEQGISPSDMVVLQTSQAFDLPPRAIKSCYIDNFFKYCYPWVPVVEPAWLQETPRQKPSLLLLQAVLLAGSRVTTPNNLEASSQLYSRAKSLFFSNYERNPVILIITCLLLQWWNPAGPERICMDNSHFWMRTGVGIAMEIGLHRENSTGRDAAYRRRLWWSLVEESSVSFLTARDFSRKARNHPTLSVNYAAICRIFGDIGESCRRKQMTPAKITQLKNELYVWVRELPLELRLFYPQAEYGLNAYCSEARQLHVVYFVAIILLFHQSPSPSPVSAGSLLAASFVAAIFDEFIIRDEIKLLGPAIHKFFLLIAGVTLLSASRIPALQSDALGDFDMVKRALQQFAERYPSSLATIHTLETLESAQDRSSESVEHLVPLQPEVHSLFQEFGPGLCRQWHLLEGSPHVYGTAATRGGDPQQPGRRRQGTESMSVPSGAMVPCSQEPAATGGFPLTGDSFDLDSGAGTEGLELFWAWTNLPDPTSWILKDTPFDLGEDTGFL
ncbi:hypothetical protein LCI18_013932 [Fusarium solani-melongenae]|uniref:Uncharacterized protein n=1 Tax=Fusarium solani subsp. cucurbitae TaxID=2747967 RepID=A0ACD3ZPF2_FUSSC|nr:hypothetical protein LCI18_013932 [Fusarium solani-melongenae]